MTPKQKALYLISNYEEPLSFVKGMIKNSPNKDYWIEVKKYLYAI